MKTVLLAWELGANLGHVGPLLLLARELRKRGHRPVFALRDVAGPGALLAEEDIPVLQAPVWIKSDILRGRPFRIASYADNLALFGFADAEGLSGMVAAWDALLALVKPDLIVADHSPTLCLAAFGAIPIAIVGNGYTVPPVHEPSFPPLFPGRPPLIAESRILDTVQAVQQRRKRPEPRTLPALFDAPVRAVATFPELDPYRAVRREPVMGPLEPMPAETPLPADPSLFAYLGEENPWLETVVQCLVEQPGAVEVFLRGDVGALRRLLVARGVRVHERPPPLAEVLARARVVLSHAGSTTAHAALAAGRVQILLPTHVEQELTADALVALGVGLRVAKDADKAAIQEALHTALDSGALRNQAHRRAVEVAARPPLDALALVAAACAALTA
ncbi:MAG TPA: nucleotide disphospho-sugar-binding domain-containing protein [Stellaceae bacterium]|nr:nucleotide disphospho-sugar-binding domain-containing protein [Stellaceae bacterium]